MDACLRSKLLSNSSAAKTVAFSSTVRWNPCKWLVPHVFDKKPGKFINRDVDTPSKKYPHKENYYQVWKQLRLPGDEVGTRRGNKESHITKVEAARGFSGRNSSRATNRGATRKKCTKILEKKECKTQNPRIQTLLYRNIRAKGWVGVRGEKENHTSVIDAGVQLDDDRTPPYGLEKVRRRLHGPSSCLLPSATHLSSLR